MGRIWAGIFCLLLACASAFAQQGGGLAIPSLTLTPSSPLALVSQVQTAPSVQGATNYFYWIVSHAGGVVSPPSGPFAAYGAPAILGGINTVTVTWTPAPGITSYDVLRTSTTAIPTGACGCAVVTGTALATLVDNLAATSAYTVATSASQVPAVMTNSTVNAIPTLPISLTSGVSGLLPIANGGTGSNVFNIGAATGILPVASGGTGTNSPGLVPGANVTITGTWPGQTIAATSASAAVCTDATPVTVTDSTTATLLQTCSIPANTLAAGSLLSVDLVGVNGTGSAQTITLNLGLSGDTQCITVSGTTAVANGQPWHAQAFLAVLTSGSSGTANESCEYASTGSGGGEKGPNGIVGNPTFAVNTTIANTFDVTETMSVANASNTITEQILKVLAF